MYPEDLKYTKDHEWIRVSGETGRVGITRYAQEQLGDIVFVELPEVGQSFTKGQQFGSIESVKAVSDLYCPLSGDVVEVNFGLIEKPESVNKDPHDAWMIIVKLANVEELSSLLDVNGYTDLIS